MVLEFVFHNLLQIQIQGKGIILEGSSIIIAETLDDEDGGTSIIQYPRTEQPPQHETVTARADWIRLDNTRLD